MITRIGITAGAIWEYLEKHEKTSSLETIIEEIQKERDLILMSIGWLAREGHIALDGEAPEYIVRLITLTDKNL
ncbi:MAG: winged helix-turn-helix domain-containing protein [Candidatus Omnitrophota bacterium]